MTDSLPAPSCSAFLTLPSSHPSLLAGPFLLNPTTSEPYLPIPNSPLILTPSRPSDIPHRVALLSSPSVDPFIFSPPKPYTTQHATERFHTQRADEADIFGAWGRGEGVKGLPVGTIRERKEGGTEDRFVGELGVIRETGFYEIRDEEERKRAISVNQSKAPGDPTILWTWFFLLDQASTGKGYITLTLRHLFSSFLLPHLNVYSMVSFAFVGNAGSRAVHLKLGFVEEGTDWVKMGEDRGGMMREEWVFRWTRKGEGEGEDLGEGK